MDAKTILGRFVRKLREKDYFRPQTPLPPGLELSNRALTSRLAHLSRAVSDLRQFVKRTQDRAKDLQT